MNSKNITTQKLVEFLLSLVIAMQLVGCAALPAPVAVNPGIVDGGVEALQPGSTLYGFIRTINGDVGTHIFSKVMVDATTKTQYMRYIFGFPINGNYAYTWADVVDSNILPKVSISNTGNVMNLKTWTDMRDYFGNLGWKEVAASSLPEFMTAIFSMGKIVPNIILIPISTIEENTILSTNKTWAQ